MDNNKIIECNKKIARFMGYTYFPHNMEGLGNRAPGWKTHIDADNFTKHNDAHNMFVKGVGFRMPDETIHTTKSNGVIWKYLCRDHNSLRYHSSWSSLMEVVEKISDIDNEADEELFDLLKQSNLQILNTSILCHKEGVYERVVEFVEWYNDYCENKK